MATDEELMEYYWLGWHECFDNVKKVIEAADLATAYGLGWMDYIVGDDVSSVDERSEADTLVIIKHMIERTVK